MGEVDVSNELLSRLHPLEIKVLPHLKDTTLSELAKVSKLQEVEAMRACQWLENKKALALEVLSVNELSAGTNAKKALKDRMPEEIFLKTLTKPLTSEEIAKKSRLDKQEVGVSIGLLKKQGLIEMKNGKISPTAKGKGYNANETMAVLKKLPCVLEDLSDKERSIVSDLKKRKNYILQKERRDRQVTLTDLGRKLAKVNTKNLKFEDKLTKEDLESGKWKKKQYRAFDVSASVPGVPAGKIHFVQEAIDYIRKIWIEMGFTEMEGNIVQTAFWDLDALFVPQDHPARETQDTFYLDNPKSANIEREAYERVRDVHEFGGNTGSKGWEYSFSREDTEQLMLRTHTTVLSAQTLWQIRKGQAKMPGKYFTVGRVFRNEKLDWKHLFEFHQVEGIVVDKNVTFAQLIGYLKIFFRKMGFPDVRCRPHHFPYTEPSVEVDVWHPVKKQWVELGGAGVFRPEVSKALIGEEVPVLAWGLGMERIIVEYFELQDLRDLYKNDIKQIQSMKRFIKVNTDG